MTMRKLQPLYQGSRPSDNPPPKTKNLEAQLERALKGLIRQRTPRRPKKKEGE